MSAFARRNTAALFERARYPLRHSPAASLARKAPFHCTARVCVSVGDRLPSVELQEDSPGNKIDLSKDLKGKALVIGVPAAFSPSCTASHIPGYIKAPKLKTAGSVFVVAVNDAFVMKAWASQLDPSGKSGIRFLADPDAAFTRALELDFTAPQIFGAAPRSKRYALLVAEDGTVEKVAVEPDNTGVDVSAAEKVLV